MIVSIINPIVYNLICESAVALYLLMGEVNILGSVTISLGCEKEK